MMHQIDIYIIRLQRYCKNNQELLMSHSAKLKEWHHIATLTALLLIPKFAHKINLAHTQQIGLNFWDRPNCSAHCKEFKTKRL
jgi:hypothetical protein